MQLPPGTRLGTYEVLCPIGAGGMGEVYRARDLTLGREVAIKILPAHFAGDAERVARFEREARTLASLNHPHIAQIYGFEQSPSTSSGQAAVSALVMELVEGEDLSARIARGPLPLDEVLPIARQIADALEAAHEHGIIHRDLKPANIKVRADGTVKVLDFGLAKPVDLFSDASPIGATVTSPVMSTMGVILGTAAYMAPEQAKGVTVDRRADIWGFGCVLYEMLTGRRPFVGDGTSETIAAILKTEPDWGPVPAAARPLLIKCLQKDPRKRLRDIGDAWLLLEDAPSSPAGPARWHSTGAWAVAAIFFAIAAVLAYRQFSEPPTIAEALTFEVFPPANGELVDSYLSVSPDGRRLAFTVRDHDGIDRIWVRDLRTANMRVVSGTEGARTPFWSPDGNTIGFAVERQLRSVDAAGGTVRTICEIRNAVGSATWNAQGTIVFGSRLGGPLYKVAAAGGAAEPATVLDPGRPGNFHALPAFLPDGRRFLYFNSSTDNDHRGVYAGSLDLAPDQQSQTRVFNTPLGVGFAASDDGASRILFVADGNLMTQRFDDERLAATGSPVLVAERIASAGLNVFFSVSGAGVLAYRHGVAGGPNDMQLTWFDREGKRGPTVGGRSPYLSIALSPDATRMAGAIASVGSAPDLWSIDTARGVASRLTSDAGLELNPVWSPDGRRLVFRSNRSGRWELYEKTIDGVEPERPLSASAIDETPTSWSRDGRWLLFDAPGPTTRADLFLQALGGTTAATPLLQSEFSEGQAVFSPDLRWIAYVSDESGTNEIYVRTFSSPNAPGTGVPGKWRVSASGGVQPRWRGDGKELFFRDGNVVMAVSIAASGATFQPGTPVTLFDPRSPYVNVWDVTPDGQRFIIGTSAAGSDATPLTVVMNWQAAGAK